jgi:hypothetical protein
MKAWTIAAALLLSLGCGGAPAPVETPHNDTQAPDGGSSTTAEPATTSVVRFDDLGISFAVPSGFHVVGDDELSARIRSAANPHLQADLQKHASEKKGIPLLTLTQANVKDPLNVTLSVVVVPADATAKELVAQQQTVMAENLGSFETTSGPKDLMLDGVPGVEITTHYADRSQTRVASHLRLYVRKGIATLLVAVWAEAAQGRADEATRVLDGLHFSASP